MDGFIPKNCSEPSLSPEETKEAVKELHKSSFRRVNRKFKDPIKSSENRYALFSFIKAPGVNPDKNGFFGVAKIRGAFHTEEEASSRAEKIIKDCDSTNSVFTCEMGTPFPLVCSGYAEDLNEVNLQNKVEKTISENVRAKRLADQRDINEIKDKRDALMANDGKIGDVDPEEKYIEQRVKLAHLRYAIDQHTEKLAECQELVKNVITNLKECDSSYEVNYMKRFMEGRRKAHIPEDTDNVGFMKYMADPIE